MRAVLELTRVARVELTNGTCFDAGVSHQDQDKTFFYRGVYLCAKFISSPSLCVVFFAIFLFIFYFFQGLTSIDKKKTVFINMLSLSFKQISNHLQPVKCAFY